LAQARESDTELLFLEIGGCENSRCSEPTPVLVPKWQLL